MTSTLPPAQMSSSALPKLELRNVSKRFETARGDEYVALQDINISVADGEFLSIIGPSGSGKTTLLQIMAGLSEASSGEVLLDGKAVHGPSRDRGVVFQQESIFPWRTVRRNVEYGLEIGGMSKRRRREHARKYLDLVHLTPFADFYPKELSGGMKQRTVIATVFANNPSVLLMDEPFGSLDYGTKARLQNQLLEIWAEEKKTTVFITHDVEEAVFLADRIVVISGGRILAERTVELPRPRSEEVRLSQELARARRDISLLLPQEQE